MVKFYSVPFELMNPHNGTNDNNNSRRTKATAVIPMVGAIVTAALLLSGLSLISSYQSAIAQTELTGGTTGGNATTTALNATTTAGNATTTAGNATTTAGNATTAGGNQT